MITRVDDLIPRRPPGLLTALVFTAGSTALMALFRYAVDPLVGQGMAFTAFLVSAAISTIYLGYRWGALAAILGGGIGLFVFTETFDGAPARAELWSMAVYIFVAALIVATLELARSALLRLRQEKAHAEVREAQVRVMTESMPQIVWAARPDGHHDYYNSQWYAFTGTTPGQTDGDGWAAAFHPDDQAGAWAQWARSLGSGEPYEVEYRLRRHDGVYRWFLGRALPVRNPAGEIERWFGTCTDIEAARTAKDQLQLISQELSHRIQNIFAIVSGLVSLSAREHPQARDYAGDLLARIQALGRAHDFVRPHSPESFDTERDTTFANLLRTLFLPYQEDGVERVAVSGVDTPVDAAAATPVALLFHELATNAMKYGALSRPAGRVAVEAVDRGDDLHITWTETGGPPLDAPPTRTGFGARLVGMSVEKQLRGALDHDWDAEGLRVTITLPRARLARSPAAI